MSRLYPDNLCGKGQQRRLWSAVIATLIVLSCQGWPAQARSDQDPGSKPHPYGVRLERHTTMTTSDGIELAADIYHPRGLDKTPTILVRIPFSKSSRNVFFAYLVGNMWARQGYTVVIQGTRGRYESGGKFYPLLGERRDGLETLSWLAKQPWYDGQIATWGGSAFGQTQWAICDQSNPGPQAVSIYFASSDFYSMFYPGGAFSLASALNWAVTSRGREDLPRWPAKEEISKGAAGFPMIASDERLVSQPIPFFRDWARHNTRNAYWQSVSGIQDVSSLRAPALLVAGWYDPFLPGMLKDFQCIKRSRIPVVAKKSRLIIGPWSHANQVTFPDGHKAENFRLTSIGLAGPWFAQNLRRGPARRSSPLLTILASPLDSLQSPLSTYQSSMSALTGAFGLPQPRLPLTLPWFEERAEQAAANHDTAAPVRIFVMGTNKWRDEQEWPLARTRWTNFYLTSNGTLNEQNMPAREGRNHYRYDPQDPVPTAGGAMIGRAAGIAEQSTVESRPDVLVYTTAPLDHDVEVTGPVQALLYVSTTAPCTDFTAKLVDVHPDGKAYNLSDGILRKRYTTAAGRPDASKIHKIRIDLWPTSNVFQRGHRIRLEISSSNFPRYDRNPNTGNDIALETRPVTAFQTIHSGLLYPSHLLLPVIPDGN